MRPISIAMTLVFVPACLAAQASGGTQATARATVNADANVRVPASFSADGRTKLEATYTRAREHHVPREAIEHRVAEGQAKGASETAIIASSGKVESNMEATQAAMIRAGRKPSDQEVESGAYAMERGVTSAQIEAMTKHASGGRSLDVAFDVLTKLNENGMPVTSAVAQVQSKLDAHASDAAITSLVTTAKGGLKVGGGL